MFFTQDDYRKIEEWLCTRTKKDTELPHADPLKGSELVSLVQEGKNKTVTVHDLVEQVSLMELPDFFNVTVFTRQGNLSLKDAVNAVPVAQRKLGLTITFHNDDGHWMIYQFKGVSINQWASLNYWTSLIEEAIEDFLIFPDDEDIIGIRDGNRTFLKLKDKAHEPDKFSGKGKIILRKNLIGTDVCSLDDEEHFKNVLTQDMVREENTVYIIQYDYDLDGKIISIPNGCTLWFQGGSINNGTIYIKDTPILGVLKPEDLGTANVFGDYATGQVMAFDIDSRSILKWWSGSEWKQLLDITDYEEVTNLITALTDKHNSDISNLATSITEINNHLSNTDNIVNNITTTVNNLSNTISNLDTIVNNHISNYMTTNIVGMKSVTVNGTKYTMDSVGNVTLPDYPSNSGSSVMEPLTIKQGDATLGNYDGTEAVTISIPEPTGTGGTANKVAHKLKFTGSVDAEYDGSEEVTVNIPTSSGGTEGGVADSTKGSLTVLDSSGTEIVNYNGSSNKSFTLPASSEVHTLHVNKVGLNTDFNGGSHDVKYINQDIDLSSGNATLDLSSLYNGDPGRSVVLVAGTLRRLNSQAVQWTFDVGYSYHPALKTILTSYNSDRRCVTIELRKPTYGTVQIHSCVANVVDTNKISYDKYNNSNNNRGMPIAMIPTFFNSASGSAHLRIFAWSNNSSGTGLETVTISPNKEWGNLLAFNIVILGRII